MGLIFVLLANEPLEQLEPAIAYTRKRDGGISWSREKASCPFSVAG